MAHARKVRPEATAVHRLIHPRDLSARLADSRLGGMVVADYLYDLFAASPLELFSRVSVLAVLDQVKKDNALCASPSPSRVQTLKPKSA